MFSFSNGIRKIILLILLFILSLSGLFAGLHKFSNFYIFFIFFILSSTIGLKIVNDLIVQMYRSFSRSDNLYYPYVVLRAIRIPLTTFLTFLFFDITFNILSKEFLILDGYVKYFDAALNYILIAAISWSAFRISYQVKEHKILNYIMQNRFSELNDDQKFKNKQKTTNIEVGFKVLNFFIFLVTSVAIVNEATGSVSGILTIGGGLMIVFGLSARDFLSNYFGGFMIFMNRTFDIGDLIILVDKNIEGVVQEIGWTAVRVETPDKRPLYIPNTMFSKVAVENPSRMSNRRIKENIKLRHEDFLKVGKICKEIRLMLNEHQGIDQDNKLIVNMDSFNDGYIDILLLCFTKTIELEGYHSIKQNILSKSYKIILENGADIAISEQTIKIERKAH